MKIMKSATSSKRTQRRILAVAGVTACAVSAGLMTAAPASASSRQFTVTNNSSATLRLEGVNPVEHTVCAAPYSSVCAKGHYPIDFEGRAHTGTELAPGGTQTFDLKYYYFSNDGYKAQLTYKIEHTNAKLEVWIETTSYTNNSRCEVVPSSAGSCTAGGLGITFKQ
jgi:hypothetical protein